MPSTPTPATDQRQTVQRRLITGQEACQILGCGETKLWQLAQRGDVTRIQLSSKMTRYDLAEVNALADSWIAAAKARKAVA